MTGSLATLVLDGHVAWPTTGSVQVPRVAVTWLHHITVFDLHEILYCQNTVAFTDVWPVKMLKLAIYLCSHPPVFTETTRQKAEPLGSRKERA